MDIDRLSQGCRPAGDCAMHHRWNNLLFLHWEVPVSALQRLVPYELTVDTFEGRAYIGLVPFWISKIRHPRLAPVPGFSEFLEINVRTYVTLNDKDPGVWFFSLDAANPFACFGARVGYKLPYFYAKMSQLTRADQDEQNMTHYESRRIYPGPNPATAHIDYAPYGTLAPTVPGTLDHFLIERYLLYSQKNSKLFVGQVHHTPYLVQPAKVNRLEEGLIKAAGIDRPQTEPIVHYSPGVNVEVFGIRPVMI
jgi:uncharacterized protein